jgi:cobalt-zinc-cadmium efflux system outer membrane protein
VKTLCLALVAAFVAQSAGCAPSTDPTRAFESVRDLTHDRAGAQTAWLRGGAPDAQVRRQIDDLLAKPIGADEAAQIALLCHPKLQAEYEHLGVAQADLVDAGLLKNPVFSAMVRWPDGGGSPNVELGVAADFLDLLFIGARKTIATAEFERERLSVADAVVSHAAETRAAFFELQGARQMLELRRTVLGSEEAAAETARRLHAAGNISQLDADREQAMLEQSRTELIDAEAEVKRKQERLAALMGMPDHAEHVQIADRLPTPPATDQPLGGLVARAGMQRLDLAAAKQDTLLLARSLKLTRKTTLIEEAEVGVSTERESEGEWVTGPEISVPLPIFNLGQARVAAARHQLRESERRYEALQQQATSDVRVAYASMAAARRRFEHQRDVVLPLRQRIVQQSQLHYNAMIVGVFELLEAKQREIDAGREYVAALTDYWTARAALERAVGGRLSVGAPSTRPATASAAASQPAPGQQDHAHHHH